MNYQTVISAADLNKQLDNPNWAIMDCRFYLDDPRRGYQEYLEGHIPGAVFVNIDQDLSGPVISGITGRHPLPPVPEIAEKVSAWGIDQRTQVVVYDNETGAYGARLWWMLRWLGHNSVAVLDGGWSGWQTSDNQFENGEKIPEPRNFDPEVQPHLIVDAQFVNDIREDSDYLLLDARSSERYNGINETTDPIAGHIPGAVSAPYSENLTEKGFFKTKTELQDRFSGLLGAYDPINIVVYCGSGVTAAHNIIAMLHSGYGMPKLYSGSWSDWITEPSRPIAK